METARLEANSAWNSRIARAAAGSRTNKMDTSQNGGSSATQPRYGLLVSNQMLVREGLKNLVANVDSEITFIDAVSLSGMLAKSQAIENVAVIIVDALLGDANFASEIGPLRAKFPEARLIFLGESNEPKEVLGAVELGADGYIPKSLDSDSTINAMRFILSSTDCVAMIFCARANIAPSMKFRAEHPTALSERTFTAGDPSPSLTPRELSVLSLLAKGLTNEQIANDLNIRPSTAKVHLLNLRRKLGAANRTEAVVIAQWRGLHI